METPLDPAVVEALASLTSEQQLEVIALAKRKKEELSKEDKRRGLAALAGSLSKSDAEEMMRIIDEGCGQVNHDAWR